MNISEKIKEMQDDLGKCHELEKNKDEGKLENMIMLMLSDGGYLGPGKIIGESSELLDFMLDIWALARSLVKAVNFWISCFIKGKALSFLSA